MLGKGDDSLLVNEDVIENADVEKGVARGGVGVGLARRGDGRGLRYRFWALRPGGASFFAAAFVRVPVVDCLPDLADQRFHIRASGAHRARASPVRSRCSLLQSLTSCRILGPRAVATCPAPYTGRVARRTTSGSVASSAAIRSASCSSPTSPIGVVVSMDRRSVVFASVGSSAGSGHRRPCSTKESTAPHR